MGSDEAAPGGGSRGNNGRAPSFVDDAVTSFIGMMVIICFKQMQVYVFRSVQGHVIRRVPNYVWLLAGWVCLTICFADPERAQRVLADFLPFVSQYLEGLSVPYFFKVSAYLIMSLGCLVYALHQHEASGTIDFTKKDRGLQYVDSLFAAGYIMQDECRALKEDIANTRLTVKQLVDSIRRRLDAISICNKGGMDCLPCANLLKLIGHPSSSGEGWPDPVVSGPLQDLLTGEQDLVAAEEAFRVWLVASERDSNTRYVGYDELSRSLKAYFSRWCHAHRKLQTKDLTFMREFLKSKLGQHLDPPGQIALRQFKLLWMWFYGFVTAVNSCSIMRLSWDRMLIAGFVDRKEAEMMVRSEEGGVCFRFSQELNTLASFALVASVNSPSARGGVLHVPIVVRPQNADHRFLVTAKVPVPGQEGKHEFVTKGFKTFSNLFEIFYQSGWRTFQPDGRDTKEALATLMNEK